MIDPHTRKPVSELASVTVTGPHLSTADAYATAAFAMGESAPQWLADLEGYRSFLVYADGRTWASPDSPSPPEPRQDRAVPADDLLPLLRSRLLVSYSPLLADTTATIVFTTGEPGPAAPAWTVDIERGRASARAGRPRRATATVRAERQVLDDVVSGRRSGVRAFLDGDLTVRGNLALALELDGLFPAEHREDARTHTRVDQRRRRGDVLPRVRPGRRPAGRPGARPERDQRLHAAADPDR